MLTIYLLVSDDIFDYRCALRVQYTYLKVIIESTASVVPGTKVACGIVEGSDDLTLSFVPEQT